MDTFLTVLGWFIVVIGAFFLLSTMRRSTRTAEAAEAIGNSELRDQVLRASCLGVILQYVVSASILGLGLWLALFR